MWPALALAAVPALTRLAPYIPRLTGFLANAWNNAPAWRQLATVASFSAIPLLNDALSPKAPQPTEENKQPSENLPTSTQTPTPETPNQALPASPPKIEASFPSLPDMQESLQQQISQNPYIQAHMDFMSRLSEGLSRWIAEKNPRGQAIIKAMSILTPFIAQSENVAKLSMQDEMQRLAMQRLIQSGMLEQQKQSLMAMRAALSVIPSLLLLPPELRDVAMRQLKVAIPETGIIQPPMFQAMFGDKPLAQVMSDINEAYQYANSGKGNK